MKRLIACLALVAAPLAAQVTGRAVTPTTRTVADLAGHCTGEPALALVYDAASLGDTTVGGGTVDQVLLCDDGTWLRLVTASASGGIVADSLCDADGDTCFNTGNGSDNDQPTITAAGETLLEGIAGTVDSIYFGGSASSQYLRWSRQSGNIFTELRGTTSDYVRHLVECGGGDCAVGLLDLLASKSWYMRNEGSADNTFEISQGTTGCVFCIEDGAAANAQTIDASGNIVAGVGFTGDLTGDATGLADADYGDWSVSTGTATLDIDVVAAAEMADADHGDVAWSGGVATVQAASGDLSVGGDITMADNNWIGLGAAAGRIEFDNLATDEVNILTANVGLGTSTPDSELHIVGGSEPILHIESNDNSGVRLYLDATAGTSKWPEIWAETDSRLWKFGADGTTHGFRIRDNTAGSNRVFIDTAGVMTVPGNQLSVSLTRSSNQTITNNTDTPIQWNSEEWDDGFSHSTVTNPEQITIPVDGTYSVTCNVGWAANTSGQRRISLTDNAGTALKNLQLGTPATTGADVRSSATTIQSTASTVYEIEAFQNSGGDLDLLGSTINLTCQFSLIQAN